VLSKVVIWWENKDESVPLLLDRLAELEGLEEGAELMVISGVYIRKRPLLCGALETDIASVEHRGGGRTHVHTKHAHTLAPLPPSDAALQCNGWGDHGEQ